ncbi:MAG: hypothetical protein PHG81_03260 [Aliarcobacter sp.]|nr:hypothetical protein [Aliarcobacter sp.]
MSMNTKLAGLFLGALIATTSAFAASSCGTGKCGGEMKKEMVEKKSASCGTGKCGANMKEDMKDNMKDNDMKGNMMNDKNDMMNNAKDMKNGSCGTGKCGSK